MDGLDAEDKMIPIDVLKSSNFSYETPPTKSSTDKKEYAVIKLNNGLTALLISDQSGLGGASQDYDGDEEDNDDSKNEETELFIYDAEDEETELFNYDAEDKESEIFDESYNDTESISHSESRIGVSVLKHCCCCYEKEKLGMSACAVCVDVGSFNDPEDMPGLAHLLEHVIGARSHIHPAEDKFGSLVNEFGGSFFSNTRCECTTYYFDCHKDNIQFFLDRFSKQLISPVLDHDTIEEEIENIKCEFQSIVWSNNHVRKLIMCSTANNTNPAHKIVNGNKIINQNISRESLLRQLCEFWKKNYSAHRITLAIQSEHSLKTLKMWVKEYFLNIPCNNLPAEVFPPCETPFNTEEFCKLYTVEPFEDQHLLQISWVLPSVVKLYKSKPLHYIRWLVVQECSGSLSAFLRMKNWASKVTCNDHRSTVDSNSIYSIFSISITLTNTGVDHLEDACRVIFTYIKFLRESIPVSWIFNEIKTVADILFTHSTETWPLMNVRNLAENMRLYPSTDYLQGEHIFSEYNSDLISNLLDLMKPNKANIMITSLNKSGNDPLDNVESLLGKKYHKSDYNPEFGIDDHTAKEYFCLPNANPFIAKNFSILDTLEDNSFPEVISKSGRLETWYKLETKFQRPESCLIIRFSSSEASKSARNFVMLEILTLVLNRVVRQEIYAALTCGYDYSLIFDENGFEIFLYGFNEKLILLLESVLECVKKSGSISDLISDEEFEDFFETAITKTDLVNEPFKLCFQMIQKVIFTPSWSYFDKLSVDKTDEPLTRSHLDTFAKTFLQTSTLQCFINGNISKEQAMHMVNAMEIFNESPSENFEQKLPIRVSNLLQGELCCKVQSFDKFNPHNYLINYYQYGICDIKEQCKLRLIVYLFEEYQSRVQPKEQITCNMFACAHEKDKKIMGLMFALKSKEDLNIIDVNLTEFLLTFSCDLDQLPINTFKELKTAFTKTIQPETIDLVEESKILWNEITLLRLSHNEITSQVPVFDQQEKEIEETNKINFQEILETFRKIIDSKSSRKLSVIVESSKKDSILTPSLECSERPKLLFIDSKTNEKKSIKNMELLKSTLSFY